MNNRYDLNLLRVFQAIADTGSISKAASRLSLSQPAVSHALNRLRKQINDPLFIRARGEFLPTSRANEIRAEIDQILLTAQKVFSPALFDPGLIRSIRIGVSDYALHTFGPALLREVAHHSPKARIEFIQNDGKTLDKLAKQDLDLACWGDRIVPNGFSSQHILNEHYLCALPRTHVFANVQEFTLAHYLECKHVIFSDGAPGLSSITLYLEKHHQERHILATSGNFLGNLSLAKAANGIVSLPSRLQHLIPSDMLLKPLPFELPSFPYGVIWSGHRDNDPAIAWIVDRMAEQITQEDPPAQRAK